jgi:hypothetical protein
MGDTRVQGAADTAMTVMAAAAAAVAGPLMALWGFNGLLALAAVMSIGILLAAYRIRPLEGASRDAGGRPASTRPATTESNVP